jgi:uncharacterized protein
MSDKVLDTYIRQYIEVSPARGEFYLAGWRTHAGRAGFLSPGRSAQQRYAGDKRITNSLQTNGVLINDEWAAFLAQHQFLVGLSLDGPAHLHNHYRRTGSGKPVFEQVMALDTLKRHRVDVNILTGEQRDGTSFEISFSDREAGAEFIVYSGRERRARVVALVSDGRITGDLLSPSSMSGYGMMLDEYSFCF